MEKYKEAYKKYGLPMRPEMPHAEKYNTNVQSMVRLNHINPLYVSNLLNSIFALHNIEGTLPPLEINSCEERYQLIPDSVRRREPISPNNLRWSLIRVRHVITLIEQQQEF